MNIILFDDLKEENCIDLSSCEAVHILNTLHLSVKDEFKTGIWGVSKGRGVITKITKDKLYFSYQALSNSSKALPLILQLAQIRPICMKRVLRFVGEVGIKGIIFTPCELLEKSYMQSSLYERESVLSLIKQGAEISGDIVKPDVYYATDFNDSFDIISSLGIKNKYLLHIGVNTRKLEKENDALSLISIGPERGWSKKEVQLFIKNGFLIYNIGSRIVRSEESAILSCYPWL